VTPTLKDVELVFENLTSVIGGGKKTEPCGPALFTAYWLSAD